MLIQEDLEVMVLVRMKLMQERLAFAEAELFRMRAVQRTEFEYQQAELAYRSAFDEFEDAWADYEDYFLEHGYFIASRDEVMNIEGA